MKKIHSYSWLGLIAVAAFLVGSASAQNELSNGRAALALQTPEALETAYQAFKNGLAISPRDAQLNFFYAATLLAREAHTDAFKQQFTSLNATIVNPSIYALEYSFPLGFANIFQPPNGVRTDGHLAYLNSKAAKIDEAISCLNQITDSNFSLTLSSAETSLLDTTVDYADVCLLRSGLRLARAALNLTNSYNVSGEYRKLYELYAAGNLTPQACLATFPQLFNLSATPAQRSDARAQIQLAYADWAKALAAIKNKRPASKGSVLGPNDNNGAATPFLFAFDSVPAAEEIGAQFNALVLSLSGQQTLPSTAKKYFALEGFKINLSRLVTSSSSLRSLAPTRFDRGFFRPSSWPDPTLGGIFPDASQDLMNDGGNFLYLIQPTIYEPYQFWLLVGSPANSGYFEQGEVRFNEINGIAVDPNGNIYVADEGNHVIRKISLDNKVSVAAGQKWTTWEERESLQQKYQGNTAYYPSILDSNVGPITADGNGTVYFASENKIFKISLDGKVLTFAGKSSWSKPKDGLGAQAAFYDISAITADKNGNIYACDANAIRKITQSAQVTTLAGKLGWDDSDGYVDGAGPVARFNDPTGIAVDDSGVVYIMDSGNGVIRKIQTNGITSTFVGDAKNGNYLDAKGTKARLNRPRGLVMDSNRNLYFADDSTIRKAKPDGTVVTIAGKLSPEHGDFRIRGQKGIVEGVGETAVFGEDSLTGLAVDRRGTLYASFESSIDEAESITNSPTGAPFPAPSPLPSALPKPSPTFNPSPTPEILSLTLSTTTANLNNGSVDIPFSLTASEKIGYASISLYSLNGFASSSSSSKNLQGLINIPSYTKSGTYRLGSIIYSWGNYPNSQSVDFYGDSIPSPFNSIAITVINPFNDTETPIVHSFALLNTEVNASTSSARIRYRVAISDNSSGFSYLNFSFINTNTYQTISSSCFNDSLIAVNGQIKTYEGFIDIPYGSDEGEWALQYLTVSDYAGNSDSVNITPELQEVKFNVSSTAANPSEPQNLYTPWPVALSVNATAVNVSAADQKVKVRLGINNDDLPTNYYINLTFSNADNSGQGDSISASEFKLVSGSMVNGIFEGEFVIPRYSKNGNYTLSNLYINESNQGENKSYSRWDDSIPAEFRKTISVTGTQDITAPVLQNFTISPSTADTRNGTISLTANFTITDDLVGLENKDTWTRSGAILLRSPSGNEFAWSEFTWANRISGNSMNGTYQVQFDLPQCSEDGSWFVDYIELRDKNNNARYLAPANLTAQQIAASTIQVRGWPRGWQQQPFAVAANTKANVAIQLANLTQNFDGSEKKASFTISPENLAQNVTLTYNGVTTIPTEVGNYTVVAFLNHPNYQGRSTAQMSITNLAQKPSITSVLSGNGTVGTAFSYQIAASNSPSSYGASGLPSGLSINTSSGLISGTPTAAGNFTVNMSASNAGGTGTATLAIRVLPVRPSITSVLSGNGTVGTAFSYQIAASNSPSSYGASGLPSGLSINTSSGLISGTPTAAGNFTVNMSASNAGGTGTATLAIRVLPVRPSITSVLSGNGTVGTAFSYQIAASNSPSSYGASGLPSGLSINTSSGLISGTPTAAGNFTVNMSASNAGGTGTATLAIRVLPVRPSITSVLSGNGTVGTAFSYQIAASNSPSSYGASGLPSGLSINTSSGLISGTPTAAGNFTVNMSASNAGGTGTATLAIRVLPVRPSITSVLSGNGTVGTAFSYQIAASNSPSSYGASGLPSGLSINTSSGLISGTPTAAGNFTVNMSASNAGGTGTATLAIRVLPVRPSITSVLSGNGTVGTAFSYQIAASNSPSSYGASGLPSGLSINTSSGLISGTPTAAGNFTVNMSASNAGGTGTATLAIRVSLR